MSVHLIYVLRSFYHNIFYLSIYLSLVALESGPLRTSFSPMQTSCNDRSPTTPPSYSETSDPISIGPYSPETCCIYHRECRTEVTRLCESHTHYHYRYKSSAAVIIIFIIILIWAYYYYYPCIYHGIIITLLLTLHCRCNHR